MANVVFVKEQFFQQQEKSLCIKIPSAPHFLWTWVPQHLGLGLVSVHFEKGGHGLRGLRHEHGPRLGPNCSSNTDTMQGSKEVPTGLRDARQD